MRPIHTLLLTLAFAAPPGNAAVRPGTYHCRNMPGAVRMPATAPEALTITSPVDYADGAGHAGKYAYDPRTKRITFNSGPMRDVLVGADILYDSVTDRMTFAPPAGEIVLSCARQP